MPRSIPQSTSQPAAPRRNRIAEAALFGVAAVAALGMVFHGCGRTAGPARVADESRAAEGGSPSVDFLKLAERHAAEVLRTAPEWASQLGVSDAVAGEGYSSRWSDYSPAGNRELAALHRRLQQELREVRREQLSGTAAVTYEIMENAYELAERRNRFGMGATSVLGPNSPYPINQLFGVHLDLPRILTTVQPLGSAADVDAYLSRLSGIRRVLNECDAMVRADARNGVLPPAFAFSGAAQSIRSLIDSQPAEHPMLESLRTRSEQIEGMPAAARTRALTEAERLLRDDVYPAYRQLAATLDELAADAGDDAGIWRLTDGAEIYQFFLDSYGANGRTAEQIHRIGLQEVARIHAEMDEILRARGYRDGGVGARMLALAKDPTVLIPNDDPSKTEMLEQLRKEVATVMERAPEWFGSLPPQQVEVRRVPLYEQDGAAGGYYTGPSLDGSRPGIYWINLKDTADWPKYSWKTMTYHEAVPGHHFQTSMQQAVQDMPLVRNMLYYSEYGEGWALYAEKLAVEMGLYRDDPLGNLGRLRFELYRAVRLVVDTGLHHKRWSREQAIDWMVENIGEHRPAATREVERYAVWPGQATSYKLGMLQIVELRAEAERELGDRFDIREFHDQLLLAGSMPLPVLERRIRSRIGSAKNQRLSALQFGSPEEHRR